MPAKMPLDDESDYAASPATSSRLRALNSSSSLSSDEYDDDRPHTVAPIRNLPLSPANRARTANIVRDDDEGSGNYESAFETTVTPRSHWLTGNSIQAVGSVREKNMRYGDRLREPNYGFSGDLGEESSDLSNDRKKLDSSSEKDSSSEDGSTSVEYEESNEEGDSFSESDSPAELKNESSNSTQTSNAPLSASSSPMKQTTSYYFVSLSTPPPSLSSSSGRVSN